jgi:hypothetical protein
MERQTISKLLRMICIVLAIGAFASLIPYGGASKENVLGYKSLCSFAPVSTIIMLFVANTLNGIRKKKFKP